jgi:hypothetical protein
MPIKTIDVDALRNQTGNIYEAVVILSKRARQLAADEKSELDERLSYFEGFGPEVEDARMLEEQARVSLEFERRAKSSETAIDEMLQNEVFFRHPEDPQG